MLCTTCYRKGCDSRHNRLMRAWIKWRLRPGLLAASNIAERSAFGHPQTKFAGPELNSLKIHNELSNMAHDCLPFSIHALRYLFS